MCVSGACALSNGCAVPFTHMIHTHASLSTYLAAAGGAGLPLQGAEEGDASVQERGEDGQDGEGCVGVRTGAWVGEMHVYMHVSTHPSECKDTAPKNCRA